MTIKTELDLTIVTFCVDVDRDITDDEYLTTHHYGEPTLRDIVGNCEAVALCNGKGPFHSLLFVDGTKVEDPRVTLINYFAKLLTQVDEFELNLKCILEELEMVCDRTKPLSEIFEYMDSQQYDVHSILGGE